MASPSRSHRPSARESTLEALTFQLGAVPDVGGEHAGKLSYRGRPVRRDRAAAERFNGCQSQVAVMRCALWPEINAVCPSRLNTICSVRNSFPPATGIPLVALKKAKVMLTL
jgi:hypothetical protein